jgi:hypothetical protein
MPLINFRAENLSKVNICVINAKKFNWDNYFAVKLSTRSFDGNRIAVKPKMLFVNLNLHNFIQYHIYFRKFKSKNRKQTKNKINENIKISNAGKKQSSMLIPNHLFYV